MAQGSNAGIITQGGGGSLSFNALLGTVPVGAVLTKIDVRGWLVDKIASGVPDGAGNFSGLNLLTGLQWVAHGGTPATITTSGNPGGAWLKLAEGYVPFSTSIANATVTSIQEDFRGISEAWRGLFYVPGATDVYWSYGEDTALGDTIDYRFYGHFYMEWATYP